MPRTTEFKAIDYPAVGESYQSPHLPASAQRTLNFYPERLKDESVVLHVFPGLNRLTSGSAGEFDRGMHVFNGVLYQVAASVLYSINSVGTRTNIGTIAGSGRVSMADNGSTMVIVTSGTEYTYDGATLSTVTIGYTPSNVEYLNNQFIYDGNDGRFAVSDVGTYTVSAGNYGTPESRPDTFVRSYVFNQYLYLFCSTSIEPWQNTGQGTPPFQRLNNAIIEDTGLSGKDAIANTHNAIYFISQHNEAHQMQGFQTKRISTVAISNEWRDYTTPDAVVQTAQFNSLDVVIFQFPTDGKTWGYVEQYDLWFELEHSVSGTDRWRGNSVAYAYGNTYVADFYNGNVYELDLDTYTNNDEVVKRERIFAPLNGHKFKNPRQLFQLGRFALACSTGVGNAAELNPQLAMSFSTDGGRTFGAEVFKKLGQQGQFNKQVETYSNKHFQDFAARIRYTEPTALSIYAASLDIREAGR